MVSELQVLPFPDLTSALAKAKPDAVFICTPPVHHIRQATEAVAAEAHVFIEKPLSHDREGVEELANVAEAKDRRIQVGYNLRFHPGLRHIKRLLESGALGRILWARLESGQYLPDWRPWQDYRQSYTARRHLGGGILLDASHEFDYLVWLLGRPTEVMCMAGKVSDLEVDVEDCADVALRFGDGAQAVVHLDFVQRGYTRTCKLVGEKGTALWDFSQNEVRVFSAANNAWESVPYTFETNDMYLAEAESFLNSVINTQAPMVTLQEAASVLDLVLAAKSAAEQRSTQRL